MKRVIALSTIVTCAAVAVAQPSVIDASLPSLEQVKAVGALHSNYRKQQIAPRAKQRTADLATFQTEIKPILNTSCVPCHGEETQEGNIRIDSLDPNFFLGSDVDWWLEILAVLTNGEMPPPDEMEIADGDRSKIVEWLSSEIQAASSARRTEQGHTSFRRMTRYEYNYVLQDLLGLPFDFAKDLPPDPNSEDGFQNSSEMLHMSAVQFGIYREAALNALQSATVSGDAPEEIYWGISMRAAAEDAWKRQDEELQKITEKHQDDPEQLKQKLERQAKRHRERPNNTHYKDLQTGRMGSVRWSYGGAKYAWKPSEEPPNVPSTFDCVVVIPRRQKLIVELGDTVPEQGNLRVRIRAAKTSAEDAYLPSLQLHFGWQASNDSAASVNIGKQDLVIAALPDQPEFYQWEIPLSEIYPRNSVRNISKMGDLPSPSEYIKFFNSSESDSDVQIDYVEVTTPVYEHWPPESHTRIFFDSPNKANEDVYAREVLGKFMSRSWRRQVTEHEIEQKLKLFSSIRPACSDFREAMLEVLSAVLSSPKFLYLTRSTPDTQPDDQQGELASRLSMFLWCSIPDQQLADLAAAGKLGDRSVVANQVTRMLEDPRAKRLSQQYVHQWLGMDLLDYLDVDRKAYRQFDQPLKEAMQKEPIAFFHHILQNNHSVIDFIHADYTMANERLAHHYGLNDIHGNHFRLVKFAPQHSRGGLIAQAGLLAMNSDGKDSHPLKRGIWLLENLLNDPPPPPPPAVPEIDLADPEIAKLTLKQRIEDHRDQAACMSCHAKIDPWGIAFENYDAIGSWRTEIDGQPVDASSRLFNGERLDGMDGLKRFLLKNRQDQFVRAMVHKMTTYALGRPLTFADRASVDKITSDLRQHGDGLATMIRLIVTSELFTNY